MSDFPSLTDEMLERARATISEVERDRPPCFSIMTEDVIRRWAYMLGDANPLWLDREYAKNTRWKSILVPPTFPETAVRGPIFNPLRLSTSKKTSRSLPGQTSSKGGGFPGLGGLQIGRQFTFSSPVKAMQGIRGTQRVVAIVDSEGREEGDCIEPSVRVDDALSCAAEECAAPHTRIALQTFDINVYDSESGTHLMRCLHHMVRFARGIPLEESKYRDVPLPHYSDEEMAALVEGYRNEYLRGSDTLFYEDVEIGDHLPAITKGPHTPHDFILYHAAFGSFFDMADRLKYLLLERFPGAAVPDQRTNVPDFPPTMHLDMPAAYAMGYPRGFDGSMQRISWFGHLITNWMGDDAFLKSLSVFHRQPLFLYDMMRIGGEVSEKNDSECSVTVRCSGVNQRGDEISWGEAVVALQSRNGHEFPYATAQ